MLMAAWLLCKQCKVLSLESAIQKKKIYCISVLQYRTIVPNIIVDVLTKYYNEYQLDILQCCIEICMDIGQTALKCIFCSLCIFLRLKEWLNKSLVCCADQCSMNKICIYIMLEIKCLILVSIFTYEEQRQAGPCPCVNG